MIVVGNFSFHYQQWWDLHAGLLGLTIGYSAAGSFTQFVRITAGRPRPDFIARCNPFPDSTNHQFFGLANVTICQSNNTDLLKDGMRSFFSGHAILSALGLGYMSLYWAGKLHLFDQKAYTFKVWLSLAPLCVSVWICLTRVANRRHHWEDVATGFFLGLMLAYLVYRQFFPPLGDPECHSAYPPRILPTETERRTTGPRLSGRRQWFSLSDELPKSRGGATNVGGVEADLERSGFITTPFDVNQESYPLHERVVSSS